MKYEHQFYKISENLNTNSEVLGWDFDAWVKSPNTVPTPPNLVISLTNQTILNLLIIFESENNSIMHGNVISAIELFSKLTSYIFVDLTTGGLLNKNSLLNSI